MGRVGETMVDFTPAGASSIVRGLGEVSTRAVVDERGSTTAERPQRVHQETTGTSQVSPMARCRTMAVAAADIRGMDMLADIQFGVYLRLRRQTASTCMHFFSKLI